jgi:hypothetical protein
MKKILLSLIASLLVTASAFGQATPVPTATATATSTPLAALEGDRVVQTAGAWNACGRKGCTLVANPQRLPIPLEAGAQGSVLSIGSELLPTWSNSLSLGGGRVSFSGYVPGVADDLGTVAATGSTITDSAALVDTVSVVTGADGTKGVHLPALADVSIGQELTVINSDVTNLVKVYSNAAGETISGQAGSTAISVAAKVWLFCKKQSASAWHCQKGVTPY